MNNSVKSLVIMLVCGFILSYLGAANAAYAAQPVIGKTYWTQHTFQYEKGRHRTTNYRKGFLVQVNTAAKVLDINRKKIVIQLRPTGEKIAIVNNKRHTGKDLRGVFDRMFGFRQVDLSKYTALERRNIRRGTVESRMSKKAVVRAIGYPPITKTPTPEGDEWRYWRSKFNTFVVHFYNDRVSWTEH